MILRVIENLLIIYYVLYFLIDWIFFGIFAANVTKEEVKSDSEENFEDYSVSILIPAYNEEVTIVTSLKMMFQLDYPDFEVIAVNDGSKDNTFSMILQAFPDAVKQDLSALNSGSCKLTTQAVKAVYEAENGRLIIIDKENGGKADAINVGINYASKKLVCTIDADSVLDRDALKQTVLPMLKDDKVFVSGGQLAVANGVILKENRVVNSRLPGNMWVQWQIVEYMKSFMISRYSLSKLNAVMIMSGAFSLYKKQDLLDVGGFLTKFNDSPYLKKIGVMGKQTVCEDMEIVVRLWRNFYDKGEKARAVFLPHPLCWTEVPDNPGFLLRQRNRWHRGLAETIKIHSEMNLDPDYKGIGLFGFPYYTFFELLSPVIKLGTLVFLLIAGLQGLFNHLWVLLALIFATMASAVITCLATIFIEQWSLKKQLSSYDALRYKTGWDWLRLIAMNILGDLIYAPFRIYAQLVGLKDFINKKNDWYKFSRTGFGEQED